jgi:hypothetical protein
MVILTAGNGVSIILEKPILSLYWNTHQWCKLLQTGKSVELNDISKK